MRAALIAAAAVLVGVVGCTHGSGSHPSQANQGSTSGSQSSALAPSRVSWHPCSRGGARLRCGSISVPLDYAKPHGRTITLALAEVPATAPSRSRQGILLVNPGGPGASMWQPGGINMASYVAQGLSPSVAPRYDVVAFDTRGVGTSVPAMHCDPAFFSREQPNYVPANAAAERVLQNRAKMYAADCQKKYGWLLPYMTTKNIARDMDQIRAALGQQKLNYLGYSYGTYIGQVYATLFPNRVRRMVLDSTVDPTGVWWADNIAQDYAFQGRINAFFAWTARYNRIYHLGATAAQTLRSYNQAMSRLTAHPIAQRRGPAIGPSELTDTFTAGAYLNAYWPYLAGALSSYLDHGSGSQLVSLFNEAGKQGENEFAVYNAVECADVAWPRNWAYWNSVNWRVYRSAPFETWDNVWFNASCAYWPVHGPAKPMRIGASGLPGILMLQGTLDAATPYAGAQRAERRLPSARMVVVVGGGNHGQSLAYPRPNSCVDGYLNRYLATGALPSRPGLVDATCAAQPDPVPSG